MDSPKEFNCIFCKETFECKEELQIHFRKHGDPKFNQSTKNKTRSIDAPGEKSNDETEMISCDVCTELFPTISKAITHKHKVHPDHDAKYFCPWCGKLFTMKHLYNKHISANHKNTEEIAGEDFPCDCCDVTFHVSVAMLYHNKFFHRQDTDLPAIGQSKKFKMVNQSSLMIYYCPFCGQEYNNKVNLHKHMSDDHSDENQSPDDVLRCPLCDAIFYHLDAYEHHLSFHSIDDMYNETNELAESVTEFSLETVPPIMERVENLEPEPKEASDGGAMGLDDLLLMAMGNSVDDENPKKSKKHKKHKKSKKSAITLDEFLNMNRDVFGEGIDFQGVEEVPSQVVAKRFKVKKKAALPNSSTKMSPKEIEKLRKQGIVIKMKGSSVKKQSPSKVKRISKNETNLSSENKPTEVNASNEVLSKLINQSNNQIKIVKKSANIREKNSIYDEKPSSPVNIEVECDLVPRYITEGDEKTDKHINKLSQDKNFHMSDSDSDKTKVSNKVDTTSVGVPNPKSQTVEDAQNQNKNTGFNEKVSNNNPFTTLKNVSQHITVKAVTPSKKINPTQSKNEIPTEDSNEDLIKIKQKGQSAIKDTSNGNESQDKSLGPLKHLSHLLTIKPVTNTKSNKEINHQYSSEDEIDLDNSHINFDEDNDINDSHKNQQNRQPVMVNKVNTPEPTQVPDKTLNVFKNLSSNVTIKQMKKPIHSQKFPMSHSSDEEEHNTDSSIPKTTDIKQSTVRDMAIKPVTDIPALSPKINQGSIKKLPIREANVTKVEESSKSQANVDLLKNLTNVTAKSIGNPRNTQISKFAAPSHKAITHTLLQNKEGINQDIEVYNIDDSDSDNGDNHVPKAEIVKPKVTGVQGNNSNSKSVVALQKLSKNLTIKSTNERSPHIKIKPDPDQNDDMDFPEDDFETESDYHEENKVVFNKTNSILQKTLKNLSKHITIKSRNSSPSSLVTTHGHDNEDSKDRFDMHYESDNDSNPGHVKITEVNDEHESPEKNYDFDEEFNDSAVVESPHDSGSDNDEDYLRKPDEDFEDIETKIQANTLKKIDSRHDFKNVGESITIKSLSEKNTQSDTTAAAKSLASLPSNLSKELSIKPFKQGNKLPQDNNLSQQLSKINPQTINKNTKIGQQQVARCANQASNQKICSSTNQTNTVNKEVTVKTFQTKTVIQEITTTVTKTIKTVNQTMKQEVQTSNQTNTQQNVLRKVQGIRPPGPQSTKNYQGVVVRHASPIMGTKVRSALTPVRPTRPAVKTSNQLVPIRPPMNVRPQIPRMPAIRNNSPSTSTNSPKPVKMTPNIGNTAVQKRPVASESTGPFSCFKKPKESLIPTDISSFGSTDEKTISFASTSQMNKSNIMNMTRTMKGNTVVSSTQMKSEISSCSQQQFGKLNNVAGLRIVKTSQVKQASHVEESQEISPAKRITMEAIEKLQKQGLLVKKPRLNTNEGEESDDEGGGDHFPSDDDFDDEAD